MSLSWKDGRSSQWKQLIERRNLEPLILRGMSSEGHRIFYEVEMQDIPREARRWYEAEVYTSLKEVEKTLA
jgi:hypothetical protein